MRQHYRSFLPFLLSKIQVFQVLCSFVAAPFFLFPKSAIRRYTDVLQGLPTIGTGKTTAKNRFLPM